PPASSSVDGKCPTGSRSDRWPIRSSCLPLVSSPARQGCSGRLLMGFGLFGKLPQKRDFVALGVPRAVLEPFETWLQSAVAASRSDLGLGWQERYLVAPIWR